jgi:hypothetical protein
MLSATCKRLFVAATIAILSGCAIPKQPHAMAGAQHLPVDWMSVSEKDWRFDALPPAMQSEVLATREAMRVERSGSYYRFYGRYSDELIQRINSVQQSASDAFLVSPRVVNASLTPEMFNTADTYDQARLDRAMNANQNMRGLQEDWERFWLLSRPSKLSNYPIQSTTGNP